MIYRFGPFVVDGARRQLTRDGEDVVVSPRLFDALLFFVEHAGELLDKDTLLGALWPGVIVEENSLSQTVSALRRLLGDAAQESRYLQTVPRRGFRFIAPVERIDRGEATAIASPAEADHAAPAATDAGSISSRESVVQPAPTAASDPLFDADRRRRLVTASVVGGIVLAVGGGATWVWRQRQRPPVLAPPAAPPAMPTTLATLAILPFRPLVTTARDELLEVGMADSLVARLSNLPGVVVRSVGSVRRFAGPDQDPMAAARALDVQWIVDGSVQRWGDEVRVTARLLDTSAGVAAWSGTFDERFTSVFDLQDAISTRVAAVLAPRLQAAQRKRLAGPGGTRNFDAYQFYLAARQQAQAVRTAGLVRSIDLYDRAIVLDPAYAQAYAGRAESRRRMVFGSDGEPKTIFPAIERDAERAIALDADLADGHVSLGWHRFWHRWDWADAEAIFQKAVALNPNDANAHFGYGQLLETVGRGREAGVRMRTARELDPLSPIQLTLDAASVFWSGDRAEGRRRLSRVFDLDPDFWVAYLTSGAMAMAEGRNADGIADLERADRLSDGSSQPAMSLGFALAMNGERPRARTIADRLIDEATRRYVPPTAYGLILAGLGETAAALDALEKALEVRDVRLTLTRSDPRWSRTVRNDARFAAVMRKVGLAS